MAFKFNSLEATKSVLKINFNKNLEIKYKALYIRKTKV